MLAIVRAFQEWRHYLQGAKHGTTVYTDHKNLEYFTTTKVLNCRQARWVELLSTFDIQIAYRKGSSNVKPDGLSRRPELRPGGGGTTVAGVQTPLLRPDQFVEAANQFIEVAGFEKAGGQDMRVYREFWHISIAGIEKVRFNRDFLESVREAARQDSDYEALRRKAQTNDDRANDDRANPNPDDRANPNPGLRVNPYTIEDGLLYYKHQLVIPQAMRETVFKAEHDSKIAGHWGAVKTVEIVSRNFYWAGMEGQVRQYVHECDSCQRNKA
jgi:hypothetical protein